MADQRFNTQAIMESLDLAEYIIATIQPADRANMLQKYDNIAALLVNKTPPSPQFRNDIVNYKTIMNPAVFKLFMNNAAMLDIHCYTNLSKVIEASRNYVRNQAINQGKKDVEIIRLGYTTLYKQFENKLQEIAPGEMDQVVNTERLQTALQTFGLVVDSSAQEPVMDNTNPEGTDAPVPENIKFDDDEADPLAGIDMSDIDKLINEDEGDSDSGSDSYGEYDEAGGTGGTGNGYPFDDEYEEEDEGEPEQYDDNNNSSGTDTILPTEGEPENQGEDNTSGEDGTENSEDENQNKKDDTILPTEGEPEDDEPVLTEEEKARKELAKRLERELGGFLDSRVDDICNVLSSLYSSGFTRAQAGLYINRAGASSPLLSIRKVESGGDIEALKNMGVNVTEDDTRRGYKTVSLSDESSFNDKVLYSAITKIVPQLGNYAENRQGGTVPTIDVLTGQDAVCYKLHLQFQSANIDYCTKENSEIKITEWIKEKRLEKDKCRTVTEWRKNINNNRTRLRSYKSMVRPWYEWSIKKIFIDALIDSGIQNTDNIDSISTIINRVSANIRNVIVVSVRSKAEYEIKVSTSVLDMEQREAIRQNLISTIASKMNLGGSSSVKVNAIAEDAFRKHGVITLSIIIDEAKANSTDIFSGDIIGEIKNEDRPSWSHALLGMTEDRQWIYWDGFMDPRKANPENRCYAIYAGSRSGKGNMTSALLSNAICSGVHVHYTDGKPETGPCLGEIAWLQGKEAYIFDGQRIGSKPFTGFMENWTNGLRNQRDVVSYIERLPRELFENPEYFTNEGQEKFCGLMRYLKSIALCFSIIDARSKGTIPMNNWDLWIFDEMTKMANIEKEIRVTFARYLAERGVKGVATASDSAKKAVLVSLNEKGGGAKKEEDNVNDDPGVQYIKAWLKWVGSIVQLINSANTIGLGKSNTNIIFIFQEATWISEIGSMTTIGNVVMQLKCTKIVGNSALANNCGEYGDGFTVKKAWYDGKVNKGTGWWAISKGSDLRSADVQVFKPFSIWTVPIDAGGTDERTTAPGESKDHKYLYGYILELCEAFNIDPAEVLHQAYLTTCESMNTLGFAGSIEEYLYDSSNLSLGETIASYQELYRKRDEANGQASGTSGPESVVTNQVNIGDDPVDESYGSEGAEGAYGSGDPEERIDYGFDENEPPAQMPTPGSTVNVPPQNASQPMPGPDNQGGGQQQQQSGPQNVFNNAVDEAQIIKQLKLMSTEQLINSNFSDNVLSEYYTRWLNKKITTQGPNFGKSIFGNNLFNYKNRNARMWGGLQLAAICISSVHYMCERGIFDANTLRNKALSQINNLNDPDDRWKIFVGMFDDYASGVLRYDEMPSEERIEEYKLKYRKDIDIDTGYGYNEGGFGGNARNAGNYQDQGGYGDNYGDQGGYGDGQGDYGEGDQDGYGDGQGGYNDNYGYDEEDGDGGFGGGNQAWDNYDPSQQQQSSGSQGYDWRQQFEEDIPDGQNSFIDNGTGILDLSPRPTQDVMRLSENDYIEVSSPAWGPIEKFKKKLFESKNGTAYEFKKRWDYVLKKIQEQHPDRSLVRKLGFTECHVIVNNKATLFGTLIGGDYEIEVTDILRIRDTLKKFTMVQELQFDGSTVQCLIDEYGCSAQEIWSIFQENRSLRSIVINLPQMSKRFDRATFPQMADTFNKMLGLQVTKMQIEQFAGSRNPRLGEKPPGYIDRILNRNGNPKRSKAASKFKNNRQVVSRDKVVSNMKKAAIGSAALIGVASIVGLPMLIAGAGMGLFGYFKGRG